METFGRIKRVVTVVTVFLIVGCQSQPLVHHANPPYAEDAANIYVSVYPAIAWADIADKLSPKNNLTIEQARQMVAQTTQVQVSQFLSTFSAALGLGLPVNTQSSTTTTAADGSSQTTGTRTQGPGAVPSSSGLASTPLTPSSLVPSLTTGPMTVGVDASTLLTAGSAIFQQAQILDNQISTGIILENYQANLITFQVNLQPKQRDVSYDAYLDLSLLPANWKEAQDAANKVHANIGEPSPVVVYPLIITDALETSSVGRSIEAMRQAALALSGVVANVGVNAGISGGTAQTNSIVGLDKNSLVTVGRVSDNTVRVRLGAENTGSAGLALVPRTYNISLVVLSRWDSSGEDKDKARITSLQAITHATFLSTEDASELPSRVNPPYLADKVQKTVAQYLQRQVTSACNESDWPGLPQPTTTSSPNLSGPELANLNLLQAVDRGDYQLVGKCLGTTNELTLHQQVTLQRLIARLIEIQNESRYSKVHIELTHSFDPSLPDQDQLVMYSDDKKQTVVVLHGGKGLALKHLQAALLVKDAPKDPNKLPSTAAATSLSSKTKILPTAISMTNDGSEITITFPSLALANLVLAATDRPLYLAIAKMPVAGKSSAYYAMKETQPIEKVVENPVKAAAAVPK